MLSNRSLQKLSDIDSVERNKVSFKENREPPVNNLKSSLEPVNKNNDNLFSLQELDQEIP